MSVPPGASQDMTPDGASAPAEPSAASRTIYVVIGSTGEYSDRGEWLTRAFATEEAARAYVEFLTARRQELAPAGDDYLDYDQRDDIAAKMAAYDPRYQEDYTGSRWHVSAVELDVG